ncbi:hypothetical protein Calab_0563 [Caldithrix abyssi DSM 13497]|uniref:Sulfotransferase family protein n=1 Tax=Caldithrix abyssi DSM 13497 TaxID=880073 RepID=H1XS42_CALAY|nr:hypothetical protein [Caldithrix abyssi]APF20145.1 hypothetical protein Cabys_3397 [Caldithrix abyssi DSM 13497]EHO40206.1 hypothetical protein Calab_0563 [Caldithrix abyssi DSM 13497]
MNRIIYILSMGHSGSTILDMTLGQFPNVFSTGELKHLMWQLYREINNIEDEEGKCTCNKKFIKCYYWSNILTNIAKEKNIPVSDLPNQFNLKYFEKLSFFNDNYYLKLQRYLVKKYPILNKFLYRKKNNIITNNNFLLYKNIFRVINKEFIVDSSKDIIRYYNIEKKNNVFPIILIRDINELKNSKYVTQNKSKLWKSWINYYESLKPMMLMKKKKDYHIISFERFLNNPYQEVKKICKKLNIDISSFSTVLKKSKYHLVAGNPMRYEEEILVKEKKLNVSSYIKSIKKSGLSSFYIDQLIQGL